LTTSKIWIIVGFSGGACASARVIWPEFYATLGLNWVNKKRSPRRADGTRTSNGHNAARLALKRVLLRTELEGVFMAGTARRGSDDALKR